jgi:NAD(P)-dependent dehydrogenase (short-subunit alcohol dehydrogenase family)
MMRVRSVVITGGNTGLGFACAKSLLGLSAVPSWHVVLACRDQNKARDAVERLAREPGLHGRVETMPLDLSSLISIRNFAAAITERLQAGSLPPLHGLVCNAGVHSGPRHTLTEDGFETTFGVNHVAHFLFVNLLLPALSAPTRIAVVTSGVHDPAQKWPMPAPAWNTPERLALGELGPTTTTDKPYVRAQRRYTTSKLANIYFTHALADRLPHGVTVNAFDPGLMPGTGLIRGASASMRAINSFVL